MNLPNRLSILRVLLIPICVVLMYVDALWGQIGALVFFGAAAFTDFLDGNIARKRNMITNFGKFIDPLADKILVLSMFTMLVWRHQFPAWVLVIIIMRELAVDGLRMLAASTGQVIAAGPLGKMKTATQMVTIMVCILQPMVFKGFPLNGIMTALTAFFTLWSGVDYFVKNRAVFSEKE